MSGAVQALPDWPRAHGNPLLSGMLRTCPEDFRVDEELGFDASGDGEHDLLEIEKTDANTAWVADRLADWAGIPPRDVGYCGLKDRHAVATQYFSVRRPTRDGTDWGAFRADGVRIASVARHHRKLRPGSHAANRFVIVMRASDAAASTAALRDRWATVTTLGVPNYFGEQRFGLDGANIALARSVLGGRRVQRRQLSLAYSAARALLFNRILAARVAAANWDRLLPGELANLDGSASVFPVPAVTPELAQRCRDFDLHPTGSLWGDGAPLGKDEVGGLETGAVAADDDLARGLARQRVEAGSRPLRVRPSAPALRVDADALRFEFRLPPGAFATAVLREIVAAETQRSLSST